MSDEKKKEPGFERYFQERLADADFRKEYLASPEQLWAKDSQALMDENQRLWAQVHSMHRDLRTLQQRGRACHHITLQPRHLPCPHPECWSGGQFIWFVEEPSRPTFSAVYKNEEIEGTENSFHLNQERWRRVRYADALSGDAFGALIDVWAWVKDK
jgi:hypothetical protein